MLIYMAVEMPGNQHLSQYVNSPKPMTVWRWWINTPACFSLGEIALRYIFYTVSQQDQVLVALSYNLCNHYCLISVSHFSTLLRLLVIASPVKTTFGQILISVSASRETQTK